MDMFYGGYFILPHQPFTKHVILKTKPQKRVKWSGYLIDTQGLMLPEQKKNTPELDVMFYIFIEKHIIELEVFYR